MMGNKKAWLRILEAFIAIILITSVLIVLYSRTIGKPKQSEEIYELEKIILDEIASDNELREIVLNDLRNDADVEKLETFVDDRVPFGFKFKIRICEIVEICALEQYSGEEGQEVYSTERIICCTLQAYKPRKLKIFIIRE